MYLFYNDEPISMGSSSFPRKNSTNATEPGGHTKGVLAVDKKSGFWLVHSVPKFPTPYAQSYKWNASETYGQTFLCLSLSQDQVNSAARQVCSLLRFNPCSSSIRSCGS